jgi:hypothetical protein
MIGPRAFRLPSETYSEALSWSVNRPMVLALAARMGVPAERFRLDFFGGTMFWVRPEALRPLRELGLAETFEEERRRCLTGDSSMRRSDCLRRRSSRRGTGSPTAAAPKRRITANLAVQDLGLKQAVERCMFVERHAYPALPAPSSVSTCVTSFTSRLELTR